MYYIKNNNNNNKNNKNKPRRKKRIIVTLGGYICRLVNKNRLLFSEISIIKTKNTAPRKTREKNITLTQNFYYFYEFIFKIF